MSSHYNVIGGGRIGGLLAGIDNGQLIRRGDPMVLTAGPIIICTRNDDLRPVLEQLPGMNAWWDGGSVPPRASDLVFVQNGMLEAFFEEAQLSESSGIQVTKALLYFAVSTRGAEPVDGGRSVVTGPQAQAVAELLAQANLRCTVVDAERYQLEMVEKYLWNCVFGLLCQRYECTVGEVVERHRESIAALIDEMLDQLEQAALDWSFPENLSVRSATCTAERAELVERMCEYSVSIAAYRGAVKEWQWRNGYLWDRSADKRNGTRVSIHGQLLQAVVPELIASS